jgi:hypothetical protein
MGPRLQVGQGLGFRALLSLYLLALVVMPIFDARFNPAKGCKLSGCSRTLLLAVPGVILYTCLCTCWKPDLAPRFVRHRLSAWHIAQRRPAAGRRAAAAQSGGGARQPAVLRLRRQRRRQRPVPTVGNCRAAGHQVPLACLRLRMRWETTRDTFHWLDDASSESSVIDDQTLRCRCLQVKAGACARARDLHRLAWFWRRRAIRWLRSGQAGRLTKEAPVQSSLP